MRWRAPRRVGQEPDSGCIGERGAVATVDLAAARDDRGQASELSDTDGRQQIAEPVVVTHLAVLVVRGGLARLRGQIPGALHPVGAPREQHPPTRGSDDLVAVERKYR